MGLGRWPVDGGYEVVMMQRMVNTEYLIVNPENPEPEIMTCAGRIIQSGGLVAFPTETVYGLGASALDAEAVQQIFLAKGRPQDNPLIVHIADWSSLEELAAEVSEPARLLGERFWPGPLTLVLPRHPRVPLEVTAGLDTVAVRWPAHPVAEALIRVAGVPIAAPSANRSGRPSPTDAGHVMEDLAGRIELILVAGMVGIGVESTVLDLTGAVPTVLRPGGITVEQLREVLPEVRVIENPLAGQTTAAPEDSASEKVAASPSPGTRYAHYAPEKPLILIEGDLENFAPKIMHLINKMQADGTKVGVLSCSENAAFYREAEVPPDYIRVMGSRQDLADVALYLFKTLRECDLADVDVIVVESFPEEDLGLTIMDRLRRACRGQVIRV